MDSPRPPRTPATSMDAADWATLVDRMKDGDDDAMRQFYDLFRRGIRAQFRRQLNAQEIEDRVHDTFVIVIQALRRGELRDPECLRGFVRTIVRRQIAAYIDQMVRNRQEQTGLESGLAVRDSRCDPEEDLIARQRKEIMLRILKSISPRDREILTRFYLYGESQDQICAEMGLSDTQFRLLKSRAKARFGQLGRRKLRPNRLAAIVGRVFERGKN